MSAMTSNQVIAGLSGFALIFSGFLLLCLWDIPPKIRAGARWGFFHMLSVGISGVLDSRQIALTWCIRFGVYTPLLKLWNGKRITKR